MLPFNLRGSPRVDARQFEEAIRRVDGKVDRVAAVASQCSEGRRDPMGKDMGKAMEYEDRSTKYNGIIWDINSI